MGAFAADNLTIKTVILEGPGTNVILKITFSGTHDHLWPHGHEIDAFIKEETNAVGPAACLFDFLDYRYEYGNEIGGPIMAACIDPARQAIRDFAIAATGTTAIRLKSLFAGSNLEKVFRFGFFDNSEDGLAFLRSLTPARPR